MDAGHRNFLVPVVFHREKALVSIVATGEIRKVYFS